MRWARSTTPVRGGRASRNCSLPGGYPAACGYRHNVRNTNFFELVERGEPYPTHEPDPADSALARMVQGRRDFDLETTTLPHPMRQGDLYQMDQHLIPVFGPKNVLFDISSTLASR